MKTLHIVLIVIGVILLVAFIGVFAGSGVYDKAVVLQEAVDKEWADVQATYQRRADLIPNLVNTVKGAAEVEERILTKVTQARAGIANAKTPEDLELAGREINTAINLAFEAYPQIRSVSNFSDLQAQLEGTENRINVARQRYNEAVSAYNSHIRGFFRSFWLNMLADEGEFPKKEGFQSKQGADEAPEVKF
ncbi:LemA family protein [Fulvivirga kasyanovii]|uniref:LemA family protein n=1 Tax=Fulvivirga kasyanovii TaxID=396812 RepID=A0ABW9RYF9_9BACT|nr:LemA family protein [Fulvivirga kasyanovii]MTI29023.1 LemA family protein [Fulvivirga kasyanovii]